MNTYVPSKSYQTSNRSNVNYPVTLARRQWLLLHHLNDSLFHAQEDTALVHTLHQVRQP